VAIIKLEVNEVVLKVIRKHWLPMLFEVIITLVVAMIPIIFYALLKNTFFSDLTLQNLYICLFLYFTFLIFIWVSLFISWIDYYLDIWILTNKRIVDVEQLSLFSRKVSSIRLDRIQDVQVEVIGIVNTFLKIGNIRVMTAAESNDLVIRTAGNPELVKEEIMRAYHKEEEEIQVVKIEK